MYEQRFETAPLEDHTAFGGIAMGCDSDFISFLLQMLPN